VSDDGEMNGDVDACHASHVIDADDSQLEIDNQSTSSESRRQSDTWLPYTY